jgi:glutamyl endopeptidase
VNGRTANPADEVLMEPELVDARQWPYIGFIQSHFPSQAVGAYSVGTGTLIGPRVVLTAGHVVYDRGKGGAATSIQVTLGGPQRFTVRAIEYQTTVQWIEQDSITQSPVSAFDFGILVLADPVDRFVTPLLFETMSAEALAGMSLNVAGYPINDLGNLYGARSAPILSPALAAYNDFRLFYSIQSRPGMSGGPVYTLDATGARIIRGVHTSLFGGMGSAVRITANVFNLLHQWLMTYRPA